MTQQRTIRRSTSCAGIGLHSGSKVTLSLKPAPANFGIRFRRADLNGFEVPATVGHIGGINYATGLARDAVRIDTVEHLLAALVSLGIDNAIVELNSPEVPIMDGSAAPFIYLIQEAGVKTLAAPRRYIKVLRPMSLSRRRQAHCALSLRPLQGHLQHRLRSPAAARAVAHAAAVGIGVRRRDRPGAHLHVPEGSGAVAAARPGARRVAGECDRDRRDRHPEQRAAVHRRVRAPQDPGCDRRPGAAGTSRSSVTWWPTAAATGCTRRLRRR